ncbi:hypothetical protein [Streptomyces galbus]|uniref:hypothetical protein n=1 Tax=Streptomyces galbus TaxID=33898 RepID=UPI0035E3D1FE
MSEAVLKARSFARLVGHTELTEFLGFERSGYPTDGSAGTWIGRAGRWADKGKHTFHSQALTTCRRLIDSAADYVFPGPGRAIRDRGRGRAEGRTTAGAEPSPGPHPRLRGVQEPEGPSTSDPGHSFVLPGGVTHSC